MIKTLKDFNRNRKVTLKLIRADSLIKLKHYDGTATSIGAGIDGNGNPATGLTEDWVEVDNKGNKVTHTGTRVGMEKLLDLAPGTLKNSSVFWVSYRVRVGNDDVILDLQDDHDLLRYLFCLGQNIVANGLEEIKTNSKADFVMYSEEEEAINKIESKNDIREGYRLLDKLDLETKIQLCTVYGYNVASTEVNVIEMKLLEAIEANPAKFLQIANDDNLVLSSLVSRALDQGIYEIKDGSVWHGEVQLGFDRPSTVKILAKDPKLVTITKAKLSGDMKIIKEALNAK